MKAVFLDRATFPTNIVISPPSGVTEWKEYPQTNNDQRLSRCQNAQIILTNKVVMDAALIQQLPDLKLICVTATGVNNVDLAACAQHGVTVVNATDYGTQSVAEHVLMLMLGLARNLRRYLIANRQKKWSDSPFFCDLQAPITTLHGKTLTIIGRGTLGTAVGRLAEAFGMTILFAEHKNASAVRPGYVAFEQALHQADFVSLHCPLNDSTYHLINNETLQMLKTDCVLINTGRGDLVDENALLESLKDNRLGGAALDVASVEPPVKDALVWSLANQPNVLLTPHVAWAADESMSRLIEQILSKIAQFCAGTDVDNLAVNRGP